MSGLTSEDLRFLERCLALAERGRGRTSPNPIVGALVVRDGTVLGEGFHAGPGHDHAEVAALKAAGEAVAGGALEGATMYVSLEPCPHHGRTPPCTEALIKAGVSRVVVAAVDPSPKVGGRGLERLREVGIEVELASGEIERRARRQNDAFRKTAVTGVPFVTYKWAMSLDGRLAADGGDARWISGAESRRQVHEMRAWSDAVMVGAGTLRRDNPRLTVRDVPCARQPLRVIVDPRLSIARASALVSTVKEGPVLAVCAETVPQERRAEVGSWGIQVVALPATASGIIEPHHVAHMLAGREVQSVLLEGGARLAASWWEQGLIDRVVAFLVPVLIGGSEAASALRGWGYRCVADAVRLREVERTVVGEDLMVSGYVKEPY